MKKLLATILCCAMLVSVTACSGDSDNNINPTTSTDCVATEPTQSVSGTISDDTKEEIDNKLEKFEGIVYLTQNGTPIYSHTKGTDEGGADLTIDSPIYIGSTSKQFCATAIMMLKEQGKLSVDDTLDKYYPEYELGKDITIKNLLTMRSGIPEILEGVEGYSIDKTESENIAIINEWIFEQPLNFEPDSQWEYSNSNFYLLSNIVEEVSGQHYHDFIRENIFTPLKMESSGFVEEVKDNELFSSGLTYDTFELDMEASGITKGAGDIISTATDMDKWMTGFRSGKIISDESYKEMTTDYSEDSGQIYCYGLYGLYKKGKGHPGHIGDYIALDYFNDEYDYNLFVSTRTPYTDKLVAMPNTLMDILVK